MGWLEDAWNQTVGKDSWIGSGQATKDIEKGVSDSFSDLSLLASGNLNNADVTLLNLASFGTLGPMTGKESATDRMQSDLQAQAEADVAADLAAQEESRMSDIRSVISGQIGARMRSPGRGMTLLSGMPSSNGNTLLTIAGG